MDKNLIPLNWNLIKHWQNWVIVMAMVIIGIFGLETLMQYFKIENKNLNFLGE